MPLTNAYPELPQLDFVRTSVPMPDVIDHLKQLDVPFEVKRAAYIMFRNESGNGGKGINNNYVGAQADSGRWPAKFDAAIVGTVTIRENRTNRERIFVAFGSWTDSVDFLVDRVQSRGLFVGGTTHRVLQMAIGDERELARAYHKEWVTGSANSEPDDSELGAFLSMYGQAEKLFAA